MSDARISRAVPLDQLQQPRTDVREVRPEADVMSLAASMGDPNVGQLQDVLVYPDPPGLDDPPETADDLDDLFRDGHRLRIVDGETRRLAAEKLGWATLSATIVPEPPEDQVVAQLDANTERIEMGEYETVRALYDHYQNTNNTLSDVGDKTGYSESYLSKVFGLMDQPDWLVDPWRHPDHPLETSYALAVAAMLSSNSLEEYAQAGGLTDEEAHQRAVDDAQLMVDVQAEHDLQVGDFRQRCNRKQKETLDQLKDQRNLEERQDDGRASKADQEASPSLPQDPDPEPCTVCGQDADTKIALDVCREDYGMLSEMKANDDVLMAQADVEETAPANTPDQTGTASQAAQALSEAAGIPPEQARQVVDQVQQEVQHGD